MKKFSQYFKTMMLISLVWFVLFVMCMPQFVNTPDLGAVTIIMSFLFMFGALMAPDNEKYEEHKRR